MRTLLIALGVYWLLTQRPAAAAPAPGPTQAVTSPGATQITIPGFGSYTNVGGGQRTQITLDPGFWSNLFGGDVAQPVPVAEAPLPSDFIAQPLLTPVPDAGTYYAWA